MIPPVPPSGGSLEIGNLKKFVATLTVTNICSPFGGIPRNWKLMVFMSSSVACSSPSSPFGGIPRNWKRQNGRLLCTHEGSVPPSGGSLEIGNPTPPGIASHVRLSSVPPSGGSLEIGNFAARICSRWISVSCSPFGGIPRNWKP